MLGLSRYPTSRVRSAFRFSGERAYRDIDRRICRSTSDATLEIVVDQFGKRLNSALLLIEWSLLARSFALRTDPVAHVFAFGFGAFAYVLLLGFITEVRYPSQLRVSSEGIRCRWAAPEVEIRWDELQSVRVKKRSSKVGHVYFTFTEAALARLPEPRARRMRRLARRTGAHYRWADIFVWSSAEETARLLKVLRTSPEARSAVEQGRSLVEVLGPPSSDLPAMPGHPAA